MRAVEEPELAELPRLDVVDEAGAGRLPGGTTRGEVAREHPVVERLGDDGGASIQPARCARPDVVGLDPRRDAVDGGRHERHVSCDPRRSRRRSRAPRAPRQPAGHVIAVLAGCCRTRPPRAARAARDGHRARERGARARCAGRAAERSSSRGSEAAAQPVEVGARPPDPSTSGRRRASSGSRPR